MICVGVFCFTISIAVKERDEILGNSSRSAVKEPPR